MAQQKTMMPQSSGGLIRYFEASKEAIKIKPEHVVGFSAALIVFEIILKFV